tara:strand:+ start:4135 stop:4695 length:561 start_codon:yes stop_codon:yes gene_type:complete
MTPKLNKKLTDIQVKMKAKKSSYNTFGKYYFRKAEDILEAVKPFLLEHGVSVIIKESVISSDPLPIIETTVILSDGESSIEATAMVGVDLNQKGMQTSQQFGAASTYGKKYALGNMFLIDDTDDADATNTHGSAAAVVAAAKKDMTNAQLKKALEFIAGGGKISAIESKYNITTAQRSSLDKAVSV